MEVNKCNKWPGDFFAHNSKILNGGQIDSLLGGILKSQVNINSLCLPYEAVDRFKIYLDISGRGFGWLLWRKLRWQLDGLCGEIIPGIKYVATPGNQRYLVSPHKWKTWSNPPSHKPWTHCHTYLLFLQTWNACLAVRYSHTGVNWHLINNWICLLKFGQLNLLW